ncbi:hypothetical protein PR002_g14146 [Phytophthora rubi]|uniref:Uncharacterized protein n=1 Tax=Phytophthora rubi TaxID=129364 RepID=A0A6A3LFV6_9STRA|nr:hypothetical protein PR002_g14146 [Phytophthora rubi]
MKAGPPVNRLPVIWSLLQSGSSVTQRTVETRVLTTSSASTMVTIMGYASRK